MKAAERDAPSGKGRPVALIVLSAFVVLVGVLVTMGWEHILFHVRFESLGLNAQGYPEYRHRASGMVFVAVPGGVFWMGSAAEECSAYVAELRSSGRVLSADDLRMLDAEQPRHQVTLRPFLIAKYEVSYAVWEEWGRACRKPEVVQFARQGAPNLPVRLGIPERYVELCRDSCVIG